jgi:aminoglycoside phosphotransferase family enzyme/predicted kinase
MSAHERRIVGFLSRPASYPHPVGTIERRETHVSHVFLAGRFAYKLKKPVAFPFVDASTLTRRRRLCRLELSLNRRLAPDVYLGMVPITRTPAGLRLGGEGRVVEWLVRMRRLPEERMLDRLVARRRVGRRQMEAVADALARFFRRAARSRAISRYGAPARVAVLVLGNLEECRPFVGPLFSEADRAFLESAYRQYLALHEPVLARRVRERRIIDGHGDLRCENICLPLPPRVASRSEAGWERAGLAAPVIFDCVEFQPAFRCGDAANDLSFLVMDMEFRGRGDLARALVARYRKRFHDPTFGLVLPFYQCHRSLVRGKVRGLAWLQHPRTAEGRRVRELARRHVRLALRYARRFAPPRLIAVGGLIGTGKSTLARSLAESLGAVWLRSDEIRLTGFAHLRRDGQGFAEGLYAPRVSEQVYQRLIRRAEALVRRGRSVVCDGTFSKAAGRAALRAIARRHGASFHFFECVVPRAAALRRVADRYARRADLSEARPEHYDRLRAGFEPVRGWPARDWTRLSGHRAPAGTFQAALDALRRAWRLGR